MQWLNNMKCSRLLHIFWKATSNLSLVLLEMACIYVNCFQSPLGDNQMLDPMLHTMLLYRCKPKDAEWYLTCTLAYKHWSVQFYNDNLHTLLSWFANWLRLTNATLFYSSNKVLVLVIFDHIVLFLYTDTFSLRNFFSSLSRSISSLWIFIVFVLTSLASECSCTLRCAMSAWRLCSFSDADACKSAMRHCRFSTFSLRRSWVLRAWAKIYKGSNDII